ncbi:glycine/sarcosine/betaine reductase selenoprotein B family protein [Nocardiopsis eucommiae]|uniref:glycine/sarcosine/betaine reductase selenoprotein B family protein n=1 Tax=Nocardiopsis eucommiae TaxID=2831970 RepID=UPI003D7057C7
MSGEGGDAGQGGPAPVDYIARTRDTYTKLGYQPYAWVHSDEDPPMAELPKPLSECRLGVASSGGVYRVGQVAFHYKDDTSFRAIDTAVPTSELRVTHFAYDTTDARRDPNCVLPLDPLRDLVSRGRIGELAPTAFGFMGGVYSARRVREQLAPELARHMVAQEIDAALLVPV